MKREFVINRHGKDYVLYAGLLDEAHQQGLRGIKTELVQAPAAQNGNVAICVAEVTTEKGIFTGIGDADPSNVNRMMVNALIRMAETRAKARALRDAVNVAMVAIEELSESAPETLMIDDLQETAQTALPAASATSAAAPATIVSLASVRQQAATHAVAESTTAAGPSVTLPTPPTPAEPVRLPTTRAAQRTAGSAATSSGTSSGGPSSLKVAPEGPPPPATPTQLETIAKLARSVGRTVSTEGLSRAAASELITRLSEERYGARRAP
jgi:hypothetical protein